MAKQDRLGKRQSRERRQQKKKPELGYYLIVTDTEATERVYFEGLHQSLPDIIKDRLVIKVINTETRSLIDKCVEMKTYDPQYRIPWIVFDRDQVKNFDQIIAEAEKKEIRVGWSNPCFEIWLFAYFGKMPAIDTSWQCGDHFKKQYMQKVNQKYSKSDPSIYRKIYNAGNEIEAIRIAKKKYDQCINEGKIIPSEMWPCTRVHELVEEIKSKG